MNFLKAPDLDRIREELKQIAMLIGPGSGYNLLLESESDPVLLPLPLADAITLVPVSLLRAVPSLEKEHQLVSVFVPNLFTQIEAGQVVVTVAQLVENFPAGLVGDVTGSAGDARVEIPASLISEALLADVLAGSV